MPSIIFSWCTLWCIKMQYERITDDGGIDHKKNSNTSRFCDVCKFWFFVNKSFNYEDYACNGCHNLLMMTFSLDNIAALNVGNVFYRCILMSISKDEALKKLNNSVTFDRGVL